MSKNDFRFFSVVLCASSVLLCVIKLLHRVFYTKKRVNFSISVYTFWILYGRKLGGHPVPPLYYVVKHIPCSQGFIGCLSVGFFFLIEKFIQICIAAIKISNWLLFRKSKFFTIPCQMNYHGDDGRKRSCSAQKAFHIR